MLRTLRIIHIALVAGMVLFFGYVLLFAPAPEARLRTAPELEIPGLEPPPRSETHPELLSLIGVAFFAITVPIGFFVRARIQRQARDAWREDDESRFRERFSQSRIVSWAMIEGSGFYAIVAYMQTRSDIALALACACIALLVAMRPTEHSINVLLEDL